MANESLGASAQLDPAPTPSQPADQTPTFTLPHGVSKPYYRFKMTMTCSGCSGAVERVLKRVDKGTGKQYIDKADSNEFNVDLETQQVLIWGANLPPFEEVEEKLAKTGKPVCVLPSF